MDKKVMVFVFAFFLLVPLLIRPGQTQSTFQTVTKTFQLAPAQIDWNQFWPKFRSYVQWKFEKNNGSGWVETTGLTVSRTYPKPNVCKFTLIFDSPETADYRLAVVVNKTVLKYAHKTGSFNYTIEYKDLRVMFDWSDLKSFSGLIFNHGVLYDNFWWRVQKDNVPKGIHIELDPTWQVTASTDDCRVTDTDDENNPPWDTINLGVYLGIGNSSGWRYGSGLRFTNVGIPRRATIQSAKIQFCAYNNQSGTILYSYIQGEDEGDAATFSTVSDYNSRSRTSALVAWDNVSAWTENTWYDSPDISSVIQEIVNNPEWVSYNALVLFWENNASDVDAKRFAYSYDDDPNKAPKLVVTYSGPIYKYTLRGLFHEDTGARDYSGVNVTVYTPNEASVTFELNGTRIYLCINKPDYFLFDLTQDREYWIGDTENATDIYVFTGDSLNSYTITFVDLADTLDSYPFVMAKRDINGTSKIIEKRRVDVTKTVLMSLSLGRKYDIVLEDGATYVFGDLIMTSDTTITLTLESIKFPAELLLTNKYVRIYATREMGQPTGNITITYEDTLNKTNSVEIKINYKNGTNVYNTILTANSFVHIWTSAENDTTYRLEVTIDHGKYGVWTWRQYFPGGVYEAPWGLDWLGASLPFSTSIIVPAFIILLVAGCFSQINAEVGAFMACVTAIILTFMGWIPIPAEFLVAAIFIAVLMAIIYGKRRIEM